MQTIELTQFEYVRVSGADAISFLQGQVTCNMEQLSAERCLAGALCNLKGRVIADFLAVQVGADCLLQVAAGNGATVQATLAKYAVFSKVEVTLDTGPVVALGVLEADDREEIASLDLPAWPQAAYEVVTAAELTSICLPGREIRHQLWCWDQQVGQQLQAQADGSATEWTRSEILAGVVHVSPEMSEQYTPQLLNYDQSGVVDFKKGCYTGQEVVARMYYRAQAKKRLYLLESKQPEISLPAGSEVLVSTAAGDASGEILTHVNSESPDQTLVLLAILPTSIDPVETRLALSKKPENLLHMLSLPYTE